MVDRLKNFIKDLPLIVWLIHLIKGLYILIRLLLIEVIGIIFFLITVIPFMLVWAAGGESPVLMKIYKWFMDQFEEYV